LKFRSLPEPGFAWPRWPNYGEEEAAAVSRVIASNQLYAKEEVLSFETAYAQFSSSSYALGVGNATQGLHLALAALGVGLGDEVIVTPYSWISSASCILMQNAIPIFCDIEDKTFGIDPIKLEECISERTRAVILVHMSGYPSRVHEIKTILAGRNIDLIEDASHAHGALAAGQRIGTVGRIGVFSLHQRKALAVGDGGIILTQERELYEKIRRLRSFGDQELSYNYRMSEFAAAIGKVRLQNLDDDNAIRRRNHSHLTEELGDVNEIEVVQPAPSDTAVFYAVLLRVHGELNARSKRLARLQNSGLPLKQTWDPLHRHPHFNPVVYPARGIPWQMDNYDGPMRDKIYAAVSLPVVESLCPHGLWELPVHPPVGDAEIEFAVEQLRHVFK